MSYVGELFDICMYVVCLVRVLYIFDIFVYIQWQHIYSEARLIRSLTFAHSTRNTGAYKYMEHQFILLALRHVRLVQGAHQQQQQQQNQQHGLSHDSWQSIHFTIHAAFTYTHIHTVGTKNIPCNC